MEWFDRKGIYIYREKERENKVSDIGVCVASSSYLMCAALRGTIYLEDNEDKDKEKLQSSS